MAEENKIKPTCFVIQSFDGGKYDLRYNETIKPALLEAEVEPQRADEILGLNPVIDKIGYIRNSQRTITTFELAI